MVSDGFEFVFDEILKGFLAYFVENKAHFKLHNKAEKYQFCNEILDCIKVEEIETVLSSWEVPKRY